MEQHHITWRGITLSITFTPEKFGLVDHVEILTDGRVPVPLTETGYRSHFVAAGTVEHHGGPVAFVTTWLDHEAPRLDWSGAQLSLF